MKTLKLEDNEARELYKTADSTFKSLLEKNWGKEFFFPKITDRIKSYEDACNYNGITPLKLSDFSFLPKEDQKSSFAFHQMTIIAKAINENHVFDWNNRSEYKYYPYFDMRTGSGFGFSYSGCGNWRTDTTVGSRLCFKSAEDAKYAGTQFLDIYKNLMIQ